MAERRRVNVREILANPDLRRQLMVPTIQAIQAREGIETTCEQAERAYYVVTEMERAAFFSLAQFRSGLAGHDAREATFVRCLRGEAAESRVDVARRDFGTIEGSPLTYRRIGLVGHIFREAPALEPTYARTVIGAQTSEDDRLVRYWWEVDGVPPTETRVFVPFAKGGPFSRFYADVFLRVAWDPSRGSFHKWYGRKGRELARPSGRDQYFCAGLTWPLAAAAFNVRWMPPGCVFAHKGPGLFPAEEGQTAYLAGVLNSSLAEFMLLGLTSREEMGGRWEVGVVKRLPIPGPTPMQRERIGTLAQSIRDIKAEWDAGNEIATRVVRPWILLPDSDPLGDLTLLSALKQIAVHEDTEEARIRRMYTELNDEIYRLYGIPDATRKTIEGTLGDRPPEILWPQMEGKTTEQKRMEHVWRLLSYAVKRVLEADDDGIVSFNAVNGEPRLVERVRQEMATLFPGRDVNQVEAEIVNELKRTVKGYRKCASLDEWLDNAFFEYHAGLYKYRPIFWHIASAQGTSRFAFGALVHYHRFDKNRMAKLRGSYLRDAIEEFRREAGLADKAGRSDDRLEWQAKVEEAQALDKKLQLIQEGHHEGAEGGERDYRILAPWKEPGERPKVWDPDLDDGVKVNIEPFEKAGALRLGKVT